MPTELLAKLKQAVIDNQQVQVHLQTANKASAVIFGKLTSHPDSRVESFMLETGGTTYANIPYASIYEVEDLAQLLVIYVK